MDNDLLTVEDKLAFLKARIENLVDEVEELSSLLADLGVDVRRLEGSDGAFYFTIQLRDRIKALEEKVFPEKWAQANVSSKDNK